MSEERSLNHNTYRGSPILVAVDCIIFGFDKESLKLLLFKRKVEPFKGKWSLIGSFVEAEEGIDQATTRILEESTGLKGIFMQELGSYGHPKRDPGGRVIAIAFYALVQLNGNLHHPSDQFEAEWFEVNEVPDLILDHNIMVKDALNQLRENAKHYPIGFELLPKKFTIPQLQLLYEAIYQKDLDRRNFSKKINAMNILHKLNEKDKSTSKKGAFLYQFDQEKYEKLLKEGYQSGN